uniref:Endoplasmic reticulum-Golgi intermediate compartment protein n=1 Tax=Cyprinus carpio TaxID=7962 RepID=A0A8C1GPD9_CYPCA
MNKLRRRSTINLVKELDAFPKVPESYVETSAFGGTVSLIVFILMALLTISEFFVYQDSWMKYEYEVDTDFTSKLKIKIDITVAMKCARVGADVLDVAGAVIASKELKYDDVSFEPSPKKKMWYQILHQIQNRLREEHSLQDVLFKSALKGYFSDPVPQYIFVPTKLHTSDVSLNMHQFSVTEQERLVSNEKGSRGVSGIFIKYKLSPLMVRVTEVHMPFSVFLVRLCGIIGGIFSTSGLVHRLIGYFVDIVCCQFRLVTMHDLLLKKIKQSITMNHVLILLIGFCVFQGCP